MKDVWLHECEWNKNMVDRNDKANKTVDWMKSKERQNHEKGP